jgi:hypothetical protein
VAVFTIQIDDKASGPGAKIADTMGSVVAALQGAGVGIDQVNLKMGAASSAASGMSGKFTDAITSTSALEGAASGLGAALNPVTLGIVAVAAAAAAAVAVVGGLAVALYEGATAAIHFAEMRADHRELDALHGQGAEVVSMLDTLGQRLPFTTQQMSAWSATLASAGVRDLPGLQRGVQAVAASIALLREQANPTALINYLGQLHELGEEGKGVKFDTLAKKLKGLGVDENDIAKQMNTTADKMKGATVDATKLGDAIQNALIGKGKGALEQFGGESAQIWAKFKEGIGTIFEGVSPAAEKFMGEVRLLAAEFFKGGAAADGAKAVITPLFTELFELGTAALRAVHLGFLDVEIAALQTAIAIAPVVKIVMALWSATGAGDSGASAATFGLLTESVGSFGDALTGLPITGTVSSIIQIGTAISNVGPTLSAASATLSAWGSSSYSVASNFVSGLVNGITDGVGRVVAAAEGLGTSAVDAVKGVLGIHSPSVVMAGVGVNTAAGMAEGISQGQAGVERASRGLGGAAVGGATTTANSSTRGGDVVINAQLIINNHGGDVESLTEQGFGSMLERLAMQAGLVPAVTT